jgi:hypothetical protein
MSIEEKKNIKEIKEKKEKQYVKKKKHYDVEIIHNKVDIIINFD